MGVKERKERERADVRERILDAARDMFVRRGTDAVTMRAIGKRIEYSPPVIYSHFQDKQQLLQELCYRDFRALSQAFGRIGRIDDPIERLRRIARAYAEFALENPQQYRFMFMTPKPADAANAIHAETAGNPEENAYAFLRQTVAEAIAAGRFRREFTDAEELSQMLWGTAHAIVSLQLAKGDDTWVDWRDPREMSRKLTDAVLRGLLREDQ